MSEDIEPELGGSFPVIPVDESLGTSAAKSVKLCCRGRRRDNRVNTYSAPEIGDLDQDRPDADHHRHDRPHRCNVAVSVGPSI